MVFGQLLSATHRVPSFRRASESGRREEGEEGTGFAKIPGLRHGNLFATVILLSYLYYSF
jgi:hypothetical protein